MARTTYDARLDKVQVTYDESLTRRSSKTTRREALSEADAIIEAEGSTLDVNRESESRVDVTYLPSLNNIMNSAYAVIDCEMRRLGRSSASTGLDNLQSRHLGVLTRSLVQLAQLEMGIREQNELDAVSDERLLELSSEAYKRLAEKGKP
jgi:hypothetical protein